MKIVSRLDFEPSNEFGLDEFTTEFKTLSTRSWEKQYAMQVILGLRKGRNTILGKNDPSIISATL